VGAYISREGGYGGRREGETERDGERKSARRERRRGRRRRRGDKKGDSRSLEACNFGNRALACGKKKETRGPMLGHRENLSLSLFLSTFSPIVIASPSTRSRATYMSKKIPFGSVRLCCTTNGKGKENRRKSTIGRHVRSLKIIVEASAS